MVPLLALWLGCAPERPEAPVHAGTPGVGLGLFASTPAYDYGPLVDEIADLGTRRVLIAVPWSVSDIRAARLTPKVPRRVVQRTLAQARDADLEVTVMPLLSLAQRDGTEWRGLVDPQERDVFWSSYATLLRQLAIDAQRAGAERVVVGSELNALESDPAWSLRIQETRAVFEGLVTYSANWDRYDQVPFWSELDEVTVTAYSPVDRWSSSLDAMQVHADRLERPLVLSEVGYPAVGTAAERPWDETTGAPYAPDLQARLLGDALSDLCTRRTAHFVWNWFGTGAADEASFTPRHRPAADVLRRAITDCSEATP